MDLARSSTLGRRWLTVACLAATASIHISIAPDHLREAPYAGVLFVALAAAALAAAVLLLITRDDRVWAAAAALSASALVAYVLSRSVGLPMLADDVGDWLNPLGVLALLSELTALVACTHELRRACPGRTVAEAGAAEFVPPFAPDVIALRAGTGISHT
jgi:hypothetical protein